MKVFIKRETKNVDATGEFNIQNGCITVLEGSKLSEQISYTEKFRGAKIIERKREGIVVNGVLKKDVVFRSASSAANFVTGSSTNGLLAWKTKDGIPLKKILSEQNQ